MIYVINTSDIPASIASGASVIILSSDSQKAIMSSDRLIDALESYEDSELNTLLSLPEWRQPCTECEI